MKCLVLTHRVFHKLLLKSFILPFICSVIIGCNFKKKEISPIEKPIETSKSAAIETPKNQININLASAQELEKLPGVGPKIAQRIVKQRTKFGRFRRSENLLLVKGINDKSFRKIRSLVKVD